MTRRCTDAEWISSEKYMEALNDGSFFVKARLNTQCAVKIIDLEEDITNFYARLDHPWPPDVREMYANTHKVDLSKWEEDELPEKVR